MMGIKAPYVVLKTRTLLRGGEVIKRADKIFVSGNGVTQSTFNAFVESNSSREFWR